MKQALVKSLSIACLALGTPAAFAAPSISTATGSVSGGSELTVSGSGFGSVGPKIVLFDDFERGSPGQGMTAQAPIGSWSSASPVYTSDARTGKNGVLVYNASSGSMRKMTASLGGDQTEVFYSFWVRIPDGGFFPGRDVTGPKMFSSDSSWKFTWLMDGSDGYNTAGFDMCFPTHSGRGSFMIAGNDYNFMHLGNDWWSWNSWMRVSVWVRGASSLPTTSASSGFFQVVSQEKGVDLRPFGTDKIFQGGGVSSKFNMINIPGWIRPEITDSRIKPVHDDIYIAVGKGSVARVEVADAATYSAAKNISIVPVTSWSSSKITAKVPQAGVGSGSQWYLYVTDAEGNTNAQGIPLNSKAPEAPGNLTVM